MTECLPESWTDTGGANGNSDRAVGSCLVREVTLYVLTLGDWPIARGRGGGEGRTSYVLLKN